MTNEVLVQLIDDLDGAAADVVETIHFGLDGHDVRLGDMWCGSWSCSPSRR